MYSSDLAFVHDTAHGDLAAHSALEVARILRAHGARGGRIVELGCGSGITARYLLSRGYEVTGIDASAAMIGLARANAPKATLRVQSIATAAIPECRAVIAVGEVLAYVPGGLPALRRVFARVHTALAPGGLLIFDFIESAVRRTYRMKSGGGPGWAIVSRATFNRARRILTRRIIVVRRIGRRLRCTDETHQVRVYRRSEIGGALRHAGFIVRMSRTYGRHPLLPGDVVAIATRI